MEPGVCVFVVSVAEDIRERGIAVAEMLAVQLGLKTFGGKIAPGALLKLFTDNTNVMFALTSSSSRNMELAMAVVETSPLPLLFGANLSAMVSAHTMWMEPSKMIISTQWHFLAREGVYMWLAMSVSMLMLMAFLLLPLLAGVWLWRSSACNSTAELSLFRR